MTLAAVWSAPGCASITRRSTQKIPVTSSPAGALVAVNGIQTGALPLLLDIETEGKDVRTWALIGLGTGLFLTTFFDYAITGAVNEFRPEEISVTLTKADGPPRVNTFFLEADGFRNVKWIRIRADR